MVADHDPSVSADLVFVALSAPRSRPPPARPRRATRAGQPPGGPVRSTPERTDGPPRQVRTPPSRISAKGRFLGLFSPKDARKYWERDLKDRGVTGGQSLTHLASAEYAYSVDSRANMREIRVILG